MVRVKLSDQPIGMISRFRVEALVECDSRLFDSIDF